MRRRRWLLYSGFLLLLAILTVAIVDWQFVRAARGRRYTGVEEIPHRKVALLLGTGKYLQGSGRENPMYRYRIEAAAALWHASKVEFILASGDHGTADYDEPSDMTRDLVALGVPHEAIYRDYAGFRTLDSIVRAQHVFGLKQCTIVSQRFHNERALYLARASGLDAIAFDAADVPFAWALKTHLREKIARVAAVVDVHVLHTKPRYYGKRIEIGREPPV